MNDCFDRPLSCPAIFKQRLLLLSYYLVLCLQSGRRSSSPFTTWFGSNPGTGFLFGPNKLGRISYMKPILPIMSDLTTDRPLSLIERRLMLLEDIIQVKNIFQVQLTLSFLPSSSLALCLVVNPKIKKRMLLEDIFHAKGIFQAKDIFQAQLTRSTLLSLLRGC